MTKVTDTTKKVMLGSIIISACAFVIGILFTKNVLVYATGIAFGLCVSLFKTFLLDRAVNKVFDMRPQDNENYMRLNYMLRYFITGAALAVSGIFMEYISFPGTAIGILSMQASAYIINIILKKRGEIGGEQK